VDQDAVEDDFTFDYAPEELGFDATTAVHIKEIKQLRPLDSRQPWGVFWVNFEKKRLPVVMLRRILGHLVLKKRAAVRQASQRAWHLHDLLFISAYGEESDRAITFAHFSQDPASPGDLPVLKVLGWDDADTVLHLVDAHRTLAEKLRWPANPANLDAWRAQWSSAFTLRHREVITTTQELVEELARLADAIRRRARTILARESENGPLRRLYAAFKAALIHDLSEDDFADVIAQTISYGLLIARFSRIAISAQNLVDMVPATNPFLRELLGTFLALAGRQSAFDFDELGIQDVVEVLNRANADAVKADFGNRTRNEDPVVHFYEHFLAAYDKKKKIQRGVFYTPQPVVSYIVRGVHELLQKEFGIEDGLASTITWGDMISRNAAPPAAAAPNKKDAAKGSPSPGGEGWGEGGPCLKLPKIRVPKAGKAEGEERDLSPDEFFVMILDVATGTGTFLVETIEVIFQHLKAKWERHGLQGMPLIRNSDLRLRISDFRSYWNAYVPAALLPRLYGYELMMAPYTIAHMKLGLKLSEINARLGQSDYLFKFAGRAHIYLTNTLEPPSGFQTQEFTQFFTALAHEAAAVNTVKSGKRFTVVMGNPPYAGVSSNNSEHAVRLVDAYKIIDGERLNEKKLWLQDDYVKFIRIGQTTLEQAGAGVLGYITNHGYLDNPTFRGMRQSLLHSFQRRQVLDLHGNAKKKERAPDGTPDQNVFEIQQGVAIGLFVRRQKAEPPSTSVLRTDLHGLREKKYAALAAASLNSLPIQQLCPSTPFYLFVAQDQTNRGEFEAMPLLSDVTLVHSVGVVTARDHLTIAFTSEEIWGRAQRFAELTEEDAREEFELRNDVQDWKVSLAQEDLRAAPLSKGRIKPILYRPFDIRFIYYTGQTKGFIARPATAIMSHMIDHKNVGLMTTRKVEVGTFGHTICSQIMTESHAVSLKEVNYLFPLWLYPDAPGLSLSHQQQPNLTQRFLRDLSGSLGIAQAGPHNLPKGVAPEDIFHYAYGVFHSPDYRRRYAAFLKIDFPRLPLTGNLELFRALARLGGELIALHLLESPKFNKPITEFIGGRSPEVEKVTYSKNTVWLDKVQTIGFKGVREDVWNLHIGGYQVCEKWLKDRKGRTLSPEDIAHYQKIVVALSETIRLMAEIDTVIAQHGGWPLK
jgi:predicted helicase